MPIHGTYTTVNPSNTVSAHINPGDGAVVGVAASVIVTFGVEAGRPSRDREERQGHHRPGGRRAPGRWIEHDDGVWGLDFRTKDYWPEGTKVHVEANVYGL